MPDRDDGTGGLADPHGSLTTTHHAVASDEESRSNASTAALSRHPLAGEDALTRIAVEQAAIAMFWVTPEGRCVFANEAASRMLGYSRAELQSSRISDLDLDFPPRRWPGFWDSLEKNGSLEFTSIYRAKDGRIFPVELTASHFEYEGEGYAVATAREISERREAERILREGQERLEVLFEYAPDGYFLSDLGGRFVEVNRAAESITGYSREELIGQCFLSLGLLPPEETPAATRGLSMSALGKPTGPGEIALSRKDGEKVWVEVRTYPLQIQGEYLILGIGRDITARKKAEKTLRLTEFTMEKAPDGIFWIGMDGRILDVNGAAVASLGYAKRNLVGKPIWELDPAVEPAEWAARREKIRSSGGMTFTSDHRCADGSLSPVEIAASHLEFEGEEFVVAFTRNIRERLQVERAVERSEADFRGLFEKAPYGIFRRTAEGQILMANPAFAEMLGYGDPGDLVSLRMGRDIWAEEEEWEEMAGRALDEAGLGGVHVTWKRRDGARITVRLYSRLVKNEEDEVEFFEEMAVDISDRVQLEEQLRQAQKMEAVGQLTGGIAHDFNNLMSVILLNTDLVRNAAESGRPLPMDDLVEVEEAARKAATMTSKLLGFSRRASLTRVPTYLPDIVSNLSSLLRRLLPEDIELRVEAEDPVCPVEADVGSVEQMILNLATNARDAMQSGGRLTLEVGNREVDEDERRDRPWLETGRYVSVGVSDTGVGMGEEVLERIFEPFFTTKPVGEGTGLGMAMVYGLTKQHGGFVTVESERGEGTRVELLFPASEELGLPADPSPEPPSDPPTHGSETILLVEDEAALRRSGKRVLERFGYRVLLAGDGEEGLRVFREGKDEVDLVISDMVMPRSGGADLYRALRDAGESVPFLLVSGYTGDEAMETTMLGPEVPIIPKPWDVNELLGQVRALLD